MSAHNGLAVLLAELSAMPPASQRAILNALSPEERDALAARGEPARVSPLPGAHSDLSPWLIARIDAVRDPASLDLAASRMTAASRQLLLRSAEAILATAPASAKPSVPGKSLFDTFGGKFTARAGR
ncbi:hypothetical protein DBR17_01180 [Sphingomonas sp. HMWF008]|nr:hypothetical protein DBR17_01180 [Sphingomonas sp. HMWF008]